MCYEILGLVPCFIFGMGFFQIALEGAFVMALIWWNRSGYGDRKYFGEMNGCVAAVRWRLRISRYALTGID